MTQTNPANPLGWKPVRQLLPGFAIPSIIAMLVGALYNIVDQIFIGNDIGYLGNAATNVAFPLVSVSLAISLMLAQGGASRQNLSLGAGDRPAAQRAIGNMISLLVIGSLALLACTVFFLEPMLRLFGATPDVMPYALVYAGITRLGLPFSMITTGMSHSIRADGAAVYSMICTVSGALLNTVLDPLFIFGFGMGIAGAAWATVIGQFVSFVLSVLYIPRYRHIRLTRADFIPRARLALRICVLGISSFCNQITQSVAQIVLNNAVTYYGALSVYGSDIPLACSGIVMKVSMIFFSVMIGIGQGAGPIISYNYGARQYGRVRQTYRFAAISATCVAVVSFLCFQLIPREIISLFGGGSEAYFAFAERMCRVWLAASFLGGIQPTTSIFFTSIGKAFKGTVVSLTRQFLFLIPLLLLLPALFGIEGLLFAQPAADTAAFVVALFFVRREFAAMKKLPEHNPDLIYS